MAEFRIPDTGLHILVLGCMSSGKSTVLNALLGRGAFPAGNRATTAQVFQIVHDPWCEENVLILCNGVMKNVFARPRPYHLDPTLAHRLAWGEMSTDFSFPSGHTTASFEGAVALILRHKKWGTVALAAAFLIAVSRICLIVHYPPDVVFGAIFGAAYAFIASWVVDTLWRLYDKKQEEKKQKQA